MLKIRLMRIGGNKRPFYRVVVQEERSKRTGGYIELLGTYNPLTEPKEVKINQERADYWVKQGAQLSEGYLRIIGKAPQRPPRKPKKEKPAHPADSGKPQEKAEEPSKDVPSEAGDAAKSETDEASGAVESAPETEVIEDSASQQTSSEAPAETAEPEITEPSDASQSDKQSAGPASEETPAEEKKE